MIVKKIQIEKLFEIFDYTISYPNEENVLIITGPNGFGKTQVLNILFNLFNRKFLFFQNLIFTKIIITLSDDVRIEILRKIKKVTEGDVTAERNETSFVFFENDEKIETYNYTSKVDDLIMRKIDQFLPIRRVEQDRWIDHRTDRILTLDDIIANYSDVLPEELTKKVYRIKSERTNVILDSINVHLIKEQRLFKKVESNERHFRGDKDQTIMIETIQSYSDELKKLISQRTQESYRVSQSLDSTYPNRLISETKRVTKEDYELRFDALKTKQDILLKNGLYEGNQKALGYSEDDSKALLVYLNDLEQKLGVFDELLEKLELFTSILNERRFTFKSIKVSREKGFFFETNQGKELKLKQLSSGEQHEVVLLYELIFKTKPSILVLIDEPEISLHITWQKEFLEDLLRIIKIQNFQVLIATHSPSIINDRWDLVYNLEKTI